MRMEYQDALPSWTEATFQDSSEGVLEVALVEAQLGIRRTPAIARATDLNFRVMFIVFSPLWGGADING